jgi:GntR family transcriptional regulator
LAGGKTVSPRPAVARKEGKQPVMPRSVSRDDPRPLYKQLKARLIEDLAANAGPGGKLASERQLVAQYGVSRITVRQALKELVHEGRIRSHPGKGFYATGRPPDTAFELELLRSFTATAMAHGRRPGGRLLHVKLMPADARVATALRLTEGHEVASLRRLRLLDGVPVSIAEDWIDAALVPGFTTLDWGGSVASLYEALIHRYGLDPKNGETVLSARLAAPEEARLLELEPASAVLVVEQIAYDPDGRPINLTAAVHHPTRYPLRLEQGAGERRPRPSNGEASADK